jgi:hypothetical protein
MNLRRADGGGLNHFRFAAQPDIARLPEGFADDRLGPSEFLAVRTPTGPAASDAARREPELRGAAERHQRISQTASVLSIVREYIELIDVPGETMLLFFENLPGVP